MPLKVNIVSTERSIWQGEASFIVVKTEKGELGILPKHEPLLAILAPHVARITPVTPGEGDGSATPGEGPGDGHGGNAQTVCCKIDAGFLSIEDDQVIIVSHAAKLVDDDNPDPDLRIRSDDDAEDPSEDPAQGTVAAATKD